METAMGREGDGDRVISGQKRILLHRFLTPKILLHRFLTAEISKFPFYSLDVVAENLQKKHNFSLSIINQANWIRNI